MESDRELLELAAKAALIDGYFDSEDQGERDDYWNPLTDDGDALRLAVKLDLIVSKNYLTNERVVYKCDPESLHDVVRVMENIGRDPYSATRRAIVRAAAEIGKNL